MRTFSLVRPLHARIGRSLLPAVLAMACLGAADSGPARSRAPRDLSPDLGRFSRTQVLLKGGPKDRLDAELEIDGVRRTLELSPHSLRSDDFQLFVQQPDGSLQPAAIPPVVTYRGSVAGVTGSRVVGSLIGSRFSAQINLGNGDIRHVAPLSKDELRFDGDELAYAVYQDADPEAVVDDWACGSGHDHHEIAAFPSRDREGAVTSPGLDGEEAVAFPSSDGEGVVAVLDSQFSSVTASVGTTGLKVAEVAFDADYEFFVKNGKSITGTVFDIETVMNAVALLYEAQLGITYEITAIVVRSSEPDPYTSTNNESLLDQFQAQWFNNHRNIRRDITHLMTGKDMDSGIIGTAHIGKICEVCSSTSDGYGYSESRYTTNFGLRRCLTAHELGHSFGAAHCDGQSDCDIMCGFLGTCDSGCDTFDAAAVTAILAERNSVTCLADQVEPLSPPFCDDFDGPFESTKWTYNTFNPMNLGGDGLTSSATTAPSPPKALRLNGQVSTCSSLTPGPDEIRSNIIDLVGMSSANLSYWTKFAGTSSGTFGHLLVEYRTASTAWTQLNRILAGGTPPMNFTLWSHVLPPAAFTSGFRIRFRLEMTDANATWWIDDVTIGAAAPSTPVLFVRQAAAAGGNGATWANAFNDLQDAISAAECSLGLVEEIWVAKGTYKPDFGSGDRTATFRMPEGVTLYGGFLGTETLLEQRDPDVNETILSGEIGDIEDVADNSYHVVTFAEGAAAIDGFTITAGNANGVTPNERGSGIYHLGVSLSETRNCLLTKNRASRAGAVFGELGGTMRFEDCVFLDNVAAFDAGGAVGVDLSVSAELVRTRFLGNMAAGFGGALDVRNGTYTIDNCLFSGNAANYGGAIYALGSSGTILSSTFSGNTADGYAGVYLQFSDLYVSSGIFWQNEDLTGTTEASQIGAPEDSTLNINYSLVQNWTGALGGVGNHGGDPYFALPLGIDGAVGTLDDDLHVMPGSAALNAGDPALPYSVGATDLDGHARVICDRIDVGAFEARIGDYDADGDVDLQDALFSPDCLNGPDTDPAPACLAFDHDGDADVDIGDLAALLACIQPD